MIFSTDGYQELLILISIGVRQKVQFLAGSFFLAEHFIGRISYIVASEKVSVLISHFSSNFVGFNNNVFSLD